MVRKVGTGRLDYGTYQTGSSRHDHGLQCIQMIVLDTPTQITACHYCQVRRKLFWLIGHLMPLFRNKYSCAKEMVRLSPSFEIRSTCSDTRYGSITCCAS